jgi:hypothetical protein
MAFYNAAKIIYAVSLLSVGTLAIALFGMIFYLYRKPGRSIMTFRPYRCAPALLAGALALGAQQDARPGGNAAVNSFVVAPEFHFDEQFGAFFNQKDTAFYNRYFLENGTDLEAALFSVNGRFYFFADFAAAVGFGRQSGPILLDPREMDVAAAPVAEYRADSMVWQLGLDHHCFHQIDREPWNTEYWNKLYIAAASNNFREQTFRGQFCQGRPLTWKQRLSWQCSYGFFIHSLWGILDSSALSWGQSYVHEVRVSARWALLRSHGCLLFVRGQDCTRIDRSGRWMWTEDLGCEAASLHGAYGLSAFLDWYVVDQSDIRENKDKLVEAGIRIFL